MTVLRIVGGVLGSMLGASAGSVFDFIETYKDSAMRGQRTLFSFERYKEHIATPFGALGAVVGAVGGYYADYTILLLKPTSAEASLMYI